MVVIDRGAVEIALVADGDYKLLGTVTDGDIRRAILRGCPVEAPIGEIMNPHFVSVAPNASEQEALGLMEAGEIKSVPVLDSWGRLLGLHGLHALCHGLSGKLYPY